MHFRRDLLSQPWVWNLGILVIIGFPFLIVYIVGWDPGAYVMIACVGLFLWFGRLWRYAKKELSVASGDSPTPKGPI